MSTASNHAAGGPLAITTSSGEFAASLAQQLDAFSAALSALQTHAAQLRTMLESQQAALADRETQLSEQLSLAAEQIRQSERLAAEATQRQEELAAQATELAQERAALESLAGELEEREATLATQAEALAAQQAALETGRQALALERQAVEQALADAVNLQASLDAQRQEIEQLRSCLETRSAELDARAAELAERLRGCEEQERQIATERMVIHQREAVLARFKDAFADIASAFSSKLPGFTAPVVSASGQAVGTPSADAREEASHAASSSIATGDGPAAVSTDHPFEGLIAARVAGSENSLAAQFTEVAAALSKPARPGDAAPTPAAPVHDSELAGSAVEPTTGSIDESALDPEDLQKLRVLRRLTGGRVSDHELFNRILRERSREVDARTGGKPKKKSWWGG